MNKLKVRFGWKLFWKMNKNYHHPYFVLYLTKLLCIAITCKWLTVNQEWITCWFLWSPFLGALCASTSCIVYLWLAALPKQGDWCKLTFIFIRNALLRSTYCIIILFDVFLSVVANWPTCQIIIYHWLWCDSWSFFLILTQRYVHWFFKRERKGEREREKTSMWERNIDHLLPVCA